MKILIIDNFDSFTFNLVDYFKRLDCEVLVYRNTVDIKVIDNINPNLIVFSPGPSIPKNAGNMMKIIDLYHKKYPMFGVCLGHQAFIEYFGGELRFVEPVHGRASAISHDGQTIFENIPNQFMAGRYHSLAAKKLPECFDVSATHKDIVMAIRHKTLPIEGVQFHPESVLTMKGDYGFKIIKNVLSALCEPKRVVAHNPLVDFFEKSIANKLSVKEQEDFLIEKEELSAKELAKAVLFLRSKMSVTVELPNAIDVCGTGGSGLQRINTSTISAFVLSALGVEVAKHGNKAASGRCGSFDLLEALQVGFQENPKDIERLYSQTKLAFLFARSFHPVMKHFAEVRTKIGKPTFFNIIGPLLNPANTKSQIIGTAFEDKMELIAETARLLDKERVAVVRGADGLDEITLCGETKVVELRDGKIEKYSLKPEDFGFKPAKFEDIKGGDVKKNVAIARAILFGELQSRHLDLVLINCAFALRIAGIEEDLKRGVSLALAAIKSGRVKEMFFRVQQLTHCPSILLQIAENKVVEVEARKKVIPLKIIKLEIKKSTRSFASAVSKTGLQVIAEIKAASPSEGELREKKNFSPAQIAELYERSGVAAISVLTDHKYFGGSLNDLANVKNATSYAPILCKDFILDEYQIYEARSHGADAILLIAALLSVDQIKDFIAVASSLKMASLCEVHNEMEVEKVLEAGAEIIGINNRDLNTFSIDLNTTNRLAELIPKNKILISESGFKTKEDVQNLPKNVNAILVGTTLMKSKNISKTLQNLSC